MSENKETGVPAPKTPSTIEKLLQSKVPRRELLGGPIDEARSRFITAEPKRESLIDRFSNIGRRDAIKLGLATFAAVEVVIELIDRGIKGINWIRRPQPPGPEEESVSLTPEEAAERAEARDNFRKLLKTYFRQDTNPEFWKMMNDDQYFDKQLHTHRFSAIHNSHIQKDGQGEDMQIDKLEYSIIFPKDKENFWGPRVEAELNMIDGELTHVYLKTRLTEKGELDEAFRPDHKKEYLDPAAHSKASTDVAGFAANQIDHAFIFKADKWTIVPPASPNSDSIDGMFMVGWAQAISPPANVVDMNYNENAFREVTLGIHYQP